MQQMNIEERRLIKVAKSSLKINIKDEVSTCPTCSFEIKKYRAGCSGLLFVRIVLWKCVR